MERRYVWLSGILLGFFFLVVLLPFALSPTPLAGGFLRYLPFGWWHFLQRNLSQMTFNWSLIGTGLVCSAGVIVLGNWLVRAVFSQVQKSLHPDQPFRCWRWRWTICFYAAVWLLFTIALGAAGILRHTTWLRDYHEPWYQERLNPYAEFRSVGGAVEQLALENGQDLEATRKAFRSQSSYRRENMLISDEFNVIFYGDRSNKIAAYLLIPRNPQLVAHGEFSASIRGTNNLVRPMSELQRTITELDTAYPPNGSP